MKNAHIFLIILTLSSCYFSKTVDREVHVRIDENIPVSLFNNGNSNFIGAGSEADYQAKFLEGMKSEFNGSQVIIDQANPEFEIHVTSFSITESTSEYTVNDTTSEDHGRKYELSELDLEAKGTVVRLSNNQSYSWSALKDKEEKVTSNRNAGQMVTGQNKEKNEYRKKDFSENEAVDLSWNCGRRAGTSIVKEIIRALK